MSLPTEPQSGNPATPPSDTPPAGTEESQQESQEQESEARTPEEVEAFWKNRQAAEARAHAERERVLREEVEALKRQVDTKRAADAAAGVQTQQSVQSLQAQLEAAQAELKTERETRIIEVRKAKYPAAAESVKDAIAAMDEADLAALNERLRSLTAPTGTRIDPNTPGRPSNGAPSEPREKSIEELKGDLERMGPAFAAELTT